MEEYLEDEFEKFERLKAEAKIFVNDQKYFSALKKYKEAHAAFFTEKMERRIKKLKDFIVENEINESDEEDNHTENDNSPTKAIGDGYNLDRALAQKLYPYQIDGILWMWKLYKSNKGGILGDDMGLGKTVQVIAFLSGLMESNQIKTALIVMPVSLIHNWQEEISKWSNGLKVAAYHGSSLREKENKLYKIQRGGGLLLTSYGTLVTSYDKLSLFAGKKFTWDYFILDEGHKIKNPTKTNKAAHEIHARHRLVLTGTPIQNNLKELWALYDFCHQGTLLGSFNTFKKQYETPITRAREKDATAGERRYGSLVAENLRTRIAPFFLRRTKAETIEHKENVSPSKKSSQSLTRKNEFILWVFLTGVQIEIYENFLKSDDVKAILSTTRSPLVELNVLKKICDHPRLFSRKACAQLRLDGTMSEEAHEELLNDSSADLVSLNVDSELLLKESGKMQALITLLENLKDEGHRTLVFSMSRKILDIAQKILMDRNWKVMRLDGTVTKMEERQARINKFQNNSTYPVFLLTTQVGGVGLTITAADRVVIYDPSWNPATDAQAVDRAYRIGQKRDVVVYRFITCGTIEEKIYRRQIFKDSITRQATSKGDQNKDPHRYFTKSELKELFVLDEPTSSKTQMQLEKLHAHERRATPELKEHIKFLTDLEHLIFGISDHDLMFKGNIKDDDIPNESTPYENDYIEKRVQMAQEQIILESQRNEQYSKKSGAYVTTYFDEAKGRNLNGGGITSGLFGSLMFGKEHNNEVYDLDSYGLDDDEEDSFIKEVEIIDKASPTTGIRKSFSDIVISQRKKPEIGRKAIEENSKSFFSTIRESNLKAERENNERKLKSESSTIRCEKNLDSYFSKIRESNLEIDKSLLVPEILSEVNSQGKANYRSAGKITSFFPLIKKTPTNSHNESESSILAPDSDVEGEKVFDQESTDCIVIEDSDNEDDAHSKPTHSTPYREFVIEDCDKNGFNDVKEKHINDSGLVTKIKGSLKLYPIEIQSFDVNKSDFQEKRKEERYVIKSSSKERLDNSMELQNSAVNVKKKSKHTVSITVNSDSELSNEAEHVSGIKNKGNCDETEKKVSMEDEIEKEVNCNDSMNIENFGSKTEKEINCDDETEKDEDTDIEYFGSETEKENSDIDTNKKVFKEREPPTSQLKMEDNFDDNCEKSEAKIKIVPEVEESSTTKILNQIDFNESVIHTFNRKSKRAQLISDSESENEQNGNDNSKSISFNSYADESMLNNSTATKSEFDESISLDEDSLPNIF